MENREEVALVLVVVDLGPLALRDDVLDIERVPAEALGERLRGLEVGPDELTQVSPPAVSSATCGARATTSAPGRGPVLLRMRGRLGNGTERVVDRVHGHS